MCHHQHPTWKYNFKVNHLLTQKTISGQAIEFYSPHYPSTEKDKDYTEGTLYVTLKDSKQSADEVVRNGLEFVFALNNRVNFPIDLTKLESPPGWLPMIKFSGSGYDSITHNNPDNIPDLWSKYQKLIGDNHPQLLRSVQWFMRAIKSEDAIDKFINCWITFNMLYGWLTTVRGEDHNNGIKALLGMGIPRLKVQREIIAEQKAILTAISQMTLVGRDDGKDRGQCLALALSNTEPKEILFAAIDAIGILRHNIFHGIIKDRSNEAERCIWFLLHLDAEIIKHQLCRI